jgi:hypothetical protein
MVRFTENGQKKLHQSSYKYLSIWKDFSQVVVVYIFNPQHSKESQAGNYELKASPVSKEDMHIK